MNKIKWFLYKYYLLRSTLAITNPTLLPNLIVFSALY